MRRTCGAIRSRILGALQPYLDAEGCGEGALKVPPADSVVTGAADLSRYSRGDVCAIFPERTEEGEGNIADAEEEHTVTVVFFHSGSGYDALMERMYCFADAFKAMVRDDPTLGGSVLKTRIAGTQWHPDAGSVEAQMTASEVELAITTHREVTADDIFA